MRLNAFTIPGWRKTSQHSKKFKSLLVLVKKIPEQKKIPLIPPVFHDNEFVTELLHSFYAEQCSLINNNSRLPTNFTWITEKRLDNVTFSIQTTFTVSTLMLKICGNSICKPLEIIYKECLSLSLFPL